MINSISINQIKPYEKNAKRHDKKQIQQVANSIKEFGFNQPVVVDKDGVLIVGHGRLEAAKLLGLKEVPSITVNLTEEQAKAYRLADNKLNESEWDMSLVIEELKGLSDSMLDLTGFEKDLLITSDEKDDVIPENAPAIAQLGDIWQLGKHRIVCGDSVKLEHVEILMAGKKAQMAFTDPPYNVAYVGGGKEKLKIMNDKMTPEQFGLFCEGFSSNLLTFTQGAIYVCMSSTEWHTVQNAFIKFGGKLASVIIWVKDRFVLGRGDYHQEHEPIMLIDQPEKIEESDGELIFYGWSKKGTRTWRGGRKQANVWKIDRPTANKVHPTMKPVMLMVKAILNNSAPGEIILDPFLGSGSTLIAAEKTDRICYGMELDPKYVDVIIKRWEDYTNSKAIKI